MPMFSIPEENWRNLGFGASILVGALLFVGYLYGGFIAGLALAPGDADDWRDIGTTAGVSSVAGMLLGSV